MDEMYGKIEHNKIKLVDEMEAVAAEEALIADVQFRLHNLMEEKNVSRAELARAMGVSEARISQIFSDNPRNLTLRTIARVFHALGEEAELTSLTLAALFPTALERSRRSKLQALIRKPKAMNHLMEALAREAHCVEQRFKVEANDNAGQKESLAA